MSAIGPDGSASPVGPGTNSLELTLNGSEAELNLKTAMLELIDAREAKVIRPPACLPPGFRGTGGCGRWFRMPRSAGNRVP